MNLNPIRQNMTELELENGTKILFSYKTPVAALVNESGTFHQYKTDKKLSRTTSKHISQWNQMGGAYGLQSQEYFDNLISEIK